MNTASVFQCSGWKMVFFEEQKFVCLPNNVN